LVVILSYEAKLVSELDRGICFFRLHDISKERNALILAAVVQRFVKRQFGAKDGSCQCMPPPPSPPIRYAKLCIYGLIDSRDWEGDSSWPCSKRSQGNSCLQECGGGTQSLWYVAPIYFIRSLFSDAVSSSDYVSINDYITHIWACKIWGFHTGDCEEWRLLGRYAMWLL
jgi:hypothetical protein